MSFQLSRHVRVLVAARFRSPIGITDASVIPMRVMPSDLDANFHLNNGRYLTIMDLGRWDLIARSGLLRTVWKRGLRPQVGSAAIRFKRGLTPFARYELRTQIRYWNEKWFFIEQRFERGGRAVAIGWIKGLFLENGRPIPPESLVDEVPELPQCPPFVQAWIEADAALSDAALRAESSD